MMMSGTTISQRDIILIPFPYSDFIGYKKRPVLVLSNSLHHMNNNDMICCAITSSSKQFHKGIVLEKQDFESGYLRVNSAVIPSKLFTILQKRAIKRIGRLKPEKTIEVIKSLNLTIEMD